MTPFENLTEISAANPGSARPMGMGGWLMKRLLNRITSGRLRVILPDGASVEKCGEKSGQEATFIIHRWRALPPKSAKHSAVQCGAACRCAWQTVSPIV